MAKTLLSTLRETPLYHCAGSKIRQDKTRQGKARQGKARQDKTKQDKITFYLTSVLHNK